MKTVELISILEKQLTSHKMINGTNGLFSHKPVASYHAVRCVSNNGVVFWISTTRNSYSKSLILRSIA